MSPLRLYFRYLGVSLRSQMEYRASFFMLAASQFLMTSLEFFGIVVMFQRFGNVRGWTLPQVALLYGMVNLSFSVAEGGARGFDLFAGLVKNGDFDRFLLRPRDTALQVAGIEFQLMRAGRSLQALIILTWAALALNVVWSAPKVALLVAAILGGACTFCGLFILGAAASFWTVEVLEIWNAVTYGGTETGQYPLAVYRPWFRQFFTWVVPIACANYLPLQAILGRPDPLGSPPLLQWLSPIVGVVFLALTLEVWKLGVRHYTSTGS
jgi:ABC-2 type transport system permease protein